MSGSSRAWVFFHVTLPLLRPSLVYGAGVALLLGLGQFTGPLLLGPNKNITVLTTDMFRATQQVPPQYDVAAAYGSPLLVFGIVVIVLNKILLGEQSRFVTHGGKAFRQVEQELEARRVRARRLRLRRDGAARSSGWSSSRSPPSGRGRSTSTPSPSTTSTRSSPTPLSSRASRRASSRRSSPWRSCCRSGSSIASLLRKRHDHRDRRARSRPPRRDPARASRP